MKSKNLVLMVVAIGCGLLAAFAVAKMQGGQVAVPTRPVLVARMDLRPGEQIKDVEKMFLIKQYPEDIAPPNAIVDPNELKDKTLNKTIRAGSHITKNDLGGGGTLTLPKGTVGVGMRVTPEQISGGLVTPGSLVNVNMVERGNNNRMRARVLLRRVPIVAVDNRTETVEGAANSGKPQTINTVTLALTEKESVLFTLAQQKGTVTLTVLNHDDKDHGKKFDGMLESLTERGDGDAGDSGNPGATDSLVEVVVPTKNLEAGTKIEDAMLVVKRVPRDLAADSVTERKSLVGKTLTRWVPSGFPIHTAALEGTPEATKLPTVVEDQPTAKPIEYRTLVVRNGQFPPIFYYSDGVKVTVSGDGGVPVASRGSVSAPPTTPAGRTPVIQAPAPDPKPMEPKTTEPKTDTPKPPQPDMID